MQRLPFWNKQLTCIGCLKTASEGVATFLAAKSEVNLLGKYHGLLQLSIVVYVLLVMEMFLQDTLLESCKAHYHSSHGICEVLRNWLLTSYCVKLCHTSCLFAEPKNQFIAWIGGMKKQVVLQVKSWLIIVLLNGIGFVSQPLFYMPYKITVVVVCFYDVNGNVNGYSILWSCRIPRCVCLWYEKALECSTVSRCLPYNLTGCLKWWKDCWGMTLAVFTLLKNTS